jgi:hypothetical protein
MPFFVLWLAAHLGLLLADSNLPTGARRPIASTMLPYQTERFRLHATPASAPGYPMVIEYGGFMRSDGQRLVVPSGNYLDSKTSWSLSGVAWAAGEELQPVPERLDILYLSYAENQFYEGKFVLPQQQLYNLLKAGYWNSDSRQQITYNTLAVSVLPKGSVVVWLAGEGRRILVGQFRAHLSDADYQRFHPHSDRAQTVRYNQAHMSPAVQQQIKAGTINSRQWENYLRPYSWQLALPPALKLTRYTIGYWSEEASQYPNTQDYATYVQALLTPHERAAPKSLRLYVRDEAGQAHQLRVRQFDEAETQAAFQQLQQAASAQPLTLRVEADKYLKEAKLLLTNGTKTLPFTKTAVELVHL